MSYQLLNITKPKARKSYKCIWCDEPILSGEVHVHEISKYDGNLQDHRWHNECNAAAQEFFRIEDICEFEAGDMARGKPHSKYEPFIGGPHELGRIA